jgi:hypothetical protein
MKHIQQSSEYIFTPTHVNLEKLVHDIKMPAAFCQGVVIYSLEDLDVCFVFSFRFIRAQEDKVKKGNSVLGFLIKEIGRMPVGLIEITDSEIS